MDKNTLSGLALMCLVIFLFMWLNKPSQQEIEAQRQALEQKASESDNADTAKPIPYITADEAARLAPTILAYGKPVAGEPGTYELNNSGLDLRLVQSTDSAMPQISGTVAVGTDKIDVNKIINNDMAGFTPEQIEQANLALKKAVSDINKFKSFSPFIGGENQHIVLENEQMRVTIGTMGAMVEEVVLKKYKTETTAEPTDITLFTPETAAYNFTFNTADQRINTSELNFRPVQLGDSAVAMTLPLADKVSWEIRYTLHPDDYIVSMEIIQKGIEAVIPASTTSLSLDWHLKMARNEIGRTFEERNSAIVYKFLGETPEEMDANKDKAEQLTGNIKWVAFKNQFFSSVIIPRKNFTSADLVSTVIKDDKYLKDMSMQALMPYNIADGSPVAFDFYFGPNLYPLLSSLDDKIAPEGENLQLNRLVPLGWGLFRWINQLIIIPVFTFLSKYFTNYGIIILLLTIFIKIIIFPFTYKSFKSQAKMRLLAPEIKEINERYPGQENAMKRQQETMALYSRCGASPFSGCLPMLLQMPVLIAMFCFFPSAIELRGQSFLWAHDLSAPDIICTLPFSIPFYGNHVSLFCLLMTAVNVIYMHITMQNQPGNTSMPGMKWMSYLMPVMFLFFFNDYASGLSYYYFLSLLITIVQTYVIRHFVIDEAKVRQQMLENAKKPRKKSGFMARLEEAQRRQQAMMREQAKQQRGPKRR